MTVLSVIVYLLAFVVIGYYVYLKFFSGKGLSCFVEELLYFVVIGLIIFSIYLSKLND